MKSIAKRMDSFATYFFAELSARIVAMERAGIDVIRLDIGSPDLPPEKHIIDSLTSSAVEPDSHGYQSHKGPQALRAAWSAMYQRVYGVTLDPDNEIVPLMGSKEGIFNFSMAYINPGEVALIPDPAYITYTNGALFAGGEPYYMPLLAENDFLPDFNAIPVDIANRAKLLWLNYPNNPTAAVASPDFFKSAVDFAHKYSLILCHDAAYTQVTFDGYRATGLLEIPGAKEVSVEFNTLSKSHNMAGWRVGAAVGSPKMISPLFKLKTNVDSHHFLPILAAATTAMTGDQSWLPPRNEVYRQRRDVVIQALQNIGLEAAVPKASLYVWNQVPAGMSSVEFANQVLEGAHVSLTPGTVFGKCGEGYTRIALTAPIDRIDQAMQRIANLELKPVRQ
jgi:LL-diaminopimelate aminotransferase